VDLARKVEVLDKQVTDAKNGHPDDFDAWHAATEVALRTVMGEDSPLLARFSSVRYSPTIRVSGMDTSGYRPAGVKKVIAILEAAKSELALREELAEAVQDPGPASAVEPMVADQAPVFIVHGHDDARKHELFRVIQDVTGVKPIILHEQPNKGRTIMEKLEAYAAASGFAVALLTGDDHGAEASSDSLQPRARQNVIFEAGYFAGRLGRDRVVLLYEEGVELPSDLYGVVYIPLDAGGAWKLQLTHEMTAADLHVDWSGLAGQ